MLMTKDQTKEKTATLLVTGAAGFIGARFVESSRERGFRIISVDEPSYFIDRREHIDIDFDTIVDRADLFKWLAVEDPPLTAIVHLGACTDTAELSEIRLRRVNVEYSQRLWTWAQTMKIPFVYASSAATYGAAELGYDDDEAQIPLLRALNPYGESKRRFDLWALSEERDGRAPPTWAGFKFFNVYGFGERHKRSMASMVMHSYDQITANRRVELFQSYRPEFVDGHQARDFIHIDDVVDVIHFALSKPIRRGIYNLGTGKARTFIDLVSAVFDSLGLPRAIDFIPMPRYLRERYQYFTEARIERLQKTGCNTSFTCLEDGVARYVNRLRAMTTLSAAGG